MIRVLLLEDEYVLRENIKEFLKDEGFDVEEFLDGEAALEAILARPHDLLLLDVRVPGKNGFELLKSVREYGIFAPAIFITSLTDTAALEKGYHSGCCDYIRKPFDLTELKLRIAQAVRSNCFKTADQKLDLGEGYVYDAAAFTLVHHGENVVLTKTESQVIELLIKNRGKVVTHQQFQDEIWGEYVDPANVRVQINNLRKKLGDSLIANIRGLGYKLG